MAGVMHGWMDENDGRMGEWTDGRMDGAMNGWMGEQTGVWMGEAAREGMGEGMNAWTQALIPDSSKWDACLCLDWLKPNYCFPLS